MIRNYYLRRKSHIACFEGKYFRKYIMNIKIKIFKKFNNDMFVSSIWRMVKKPIKTHWIKLMHDEHLTIFMLKHNYNWINK